MNELVKRELEDISDYGKYYTQRVYCTNCGRHDSIYVLKGQTRPSVVTCERCGCSTAR